MNKKKVSILSHFCLSAIIINSPFVFAEVIVLKSGQIIEEKIIEKTSSYVKVDMDGAPVTLFLDEIDSIDGKNKIPTSEETRVISESFPEEIENVIQAFFQHSNNFYQNRSEDELRQAFSYMSGYIYDEFKSRREKEIADCISLLMSDIKITKNNLTEDTADGNVQFLRTCRKDNDEAERKNVTLRIVLKREEVGWKIKSIGKIDN
jgi:hypothetical protein